MPAQDKIVIIFLLARGLDNMKFLLLFLMSFSLFAGNYFPVEGVGNCETTSKTVFTKMDKCLKHYSKTCIDIPTSYNCAYHIAVDEIVDDVANPNYEAESNITTCEDEATCSEALQTLTCETPEHFKLIAQDYSRVYCTKILSYPQIPSGRKTVVVDEAKKAIFDEQKEEEEAEVKADKDAKKAAKDYFKSIDCSTLLTPFEINACNYIKR